MSPVPESSFDSFIKNKQGTEVTMVKKEVHGPWDPRERSSGCGECRENRGKRNKWYHTGRIYSDSHLYWWCHEGCDSQFTKFLKNSNHPGPLRTGSSTSVYKRAPPVQHRVPTRRNHSHPPDKTSPWTVISGSPAWQKTNWPCQKNWLGRTTKKAYVQNLVHEPILFDIQRVFYLPLKTLKLEVFF